MSKAFSGETKRFNVVSTAAQARQIDQWRREQPSPMPNVSEAIRRLIDIGLETEKRTTSRRAPRLSK
jgi:hypothetical protein